MITLIITAAVALVAADRSRRNDDLRLRVHANLTR